MAMIKINLSNNKKSMDLSNIGGLDFTKVKIKAVLLVMILIYAIPEHVLLPMWQENKNVIEQELSSKRTELSSLKNKLNQSQSLEKQIEELKNQEMTLGMKLAAVKKAISEKKNPASMLLYIAKNIPADLWIKSLSIEGDRMTIVGEALNYTSIGSFVESLRSSVFIKEANIISTKSEARPSDKRRIESFETKFVIARFDQ